VRSAPCTKRRGAYVSWFGLKTKVDCFSQFSLKIGSYVFSSLGLKTGSCGLMIWPTKSPRRFLGLGLKTKWDTVCRLCHKTDGMMKMALDMRRDLVTCFVWKQVGLVFLRLASRLAKARRGWCTWHYHGGHVEMKLKMVRSIRQAVSNSSNLILPFSLY
jgi:hypothetical protein